MLTFAINLLWVRLGKVGGTEVVIRNLFDGFEMLQDDFKAILIVSKDNGDSFKHYIEEDKRYEMIIADIYSANILKRIIWQNLHLNALIRKNGIDKCFSPVYDRPVLNGKIKYINVIHDIQAYHYPEYHPFHEVIYSKFLWCVDRNKSKGVVCISEFVAKDIKKIYHFNDKKITVIYNPVIVKADDKCDFSVLAGKYGIEKRKYYYTVSQLIKHKNVDVLLKVMCEVKGRKEFPQILLISGINGNARDKLFEQIDALKIRDNVIFTGYVQDDERNTLYENSKAFLFPSVFEGFGIPPIEAMLCGATVITTKCSCIPEVTQNKANYVCDPYDVDEWVRCMAGAINRSNELDISRYDIEKIAKEYFAYFYSIWV